MKPIPPYDEPYRRQSRPPDPTPSDSEAPSADRSGRWELILEVFAALILVLAGVCAVQSVHRRPTTDLAAVQADPSRTMAIDSTDFSPSKGNSTRPTPSVSASQHTAPPKPETVDPASRSPAALAAEETREHVSPPPDELTAKTSSAKGGGQHGSPPAQATPIQPATPAKLGSNNSVYLDDLQELDSTVGQGTLGKRGDTGYPPYDGLYGQKMLFRGRQPSHALSLYPPDSGVASVAYNLGGEYRVFRAMAAILDMSPNSTRQLKGDPFFMGGPASPLTFRVMGDGKLLWESRPMQKCGQAHACEVAVERVNMLELRVFCPASNYYSWAAWLDPLLEK